MLQYLFGLNEPLIDDESMLVCSRGKETPFVKGVRLDNIANERYHLLQVHNQ